MYLATDMDPKWIEEAKKHVGLAEVPGEKSSPVILGWLKRLKAWWSDDATPWCGTFSGACMDTAGIPLPKYWMRAKDWLNWGHVIYEPCYGCIAVFERPGGGHVGFVVGQTKDGYLMVLGGNQGDKVSIAPFDRSRVIGYRYPTADYPSDPLPILSRNGAKPSTDEA
jgi:uncharacterized protein (TIGR02594 family)